jgi:hypothetical protein
VIATATVALSPGAVPQVPPTDVSGALVVYGNVRGAPFAFARLTAGATVSTLIVCGPLDPVFPTLSVCAAVTTKLPFVRLVPSVRVQLPAVQAVVPLWVPDPPIEIDTVALSPGAVPHAPPTDVTATFVENGNVRGVPLTLVTVTTGAETSTTMFWPPVVPVLPAMSVCVTVTVYVPFAERGVVKVCVQLPAVQGAVPF